MQPSSQPPSASIRPQPRRDGCRHVRPNAPSLPPSLPGNNPQGRREGRGESLGEDTNAAEDGLGKGECGLDRLQPHLRSDLRLRQNLSVQTPVQTLR